MNLPDTYAKLGEVVYQISLVEVTLQDLYNTRDQYLYEITTKLQQNDIEQTDTRQIHSSNDEGNSRSGSTT